MASDAGKPSMSQAQRAALFLMALGENQAAQVLKHMGPKEVQSLGTTMRTLGDISQAQIAAVLDDFLQSVGNQSSLSIGSEEYLNNILQKALGREKAQSVLSRISIGSQSKGLDMLKWMDSQAIYDLIRNEHPQIIAIVLVYLEKEHASEVLALLPEEIRTEVVMRVAKLDGVNPTALSELDAIMEQRFSGTSNLKVSNIGGVRTAAEMLNGLRGEVGSQVIEKMTEEDADLSSQIQDQMFIFENLLELADRDTQTLLREISTDVLVIALKGASQEMQEKMFNNMSKRAAEMMRDDLETKGPVRLKEVEEAQKNILVVARTLGDEGKIALGEAGEDFV
jgi:flagellar motor switch protein FliG